MYLCASLVDNASLDAALGEPCRHHQTGRSGTDDEDVDMISLCANSHDCAEVGEGFDSR